MKTAITTTPPVAYFTKRLEIEWTEEMDVALVDNSTVRIATLESDEGPFLDRDFHIGMIKVGIVVCIEGNEANLIFHQGAIVILVVLMIVGGATEEGSLNLVPRRVHGRGTGIDVLIGCLHEKILELGLDQRNASCIR